MGAAEAQTPAVFAALGDRRRLEMLRRLAAEGPLSIRELTKGSGVTRQAVTKHLDVLAEVGLVSDRREGRERVFELEARRLERARRDLDTISARWDRALGRLREQVDG